MFLEALFVNKGEVSGDCGVMNSLCMNAWILKRVGTVMVSVLITKPAEMLLPRMFDTTEHLSSSGAHGGVSDSLLRPSMSYFFEPRQTISKEDLNFKSIVENSKEVNKLGPKKSMQRSHSIKSVGKAIINMASMKTLAKRNPEHDLRRFWPLHIQRLHLIVSYATFVITVIHIYRVEWHEWECGKFLTVYRAILTVLSWMAVAFFCLLPLSFCIAYSLRFAPSIVWMWLSEVAVDLLLGWLGLNFLSVFVSLLAGLLYVKLYPCFVKLYKKCGCLAKLYEKCCCETKPCCSKRSPRASRVTPYNQTNNYEKKVIKKPVNIKLNASSAWSTPKHRRVEKNDSSSDEEIAVKKQHTSSAWPTPKHLPSEKVGGSNITKGHSSVAWSNSKKNHHKDDCNSSSAHHKAEGVHASAASLNANGDSDDYDSSTSSEDEHGIAKRVLLTKRSSVEFWLSCLPYCISSDNDLRKPLDGSEIFIDIDLIQHCLFLIYFAPVTRKFNNISQKENYKIERNPTLSLILCVITPLWIIILTV